MSTWTYRFSCIKQKRFGFIFGSKQKRKTASNQGKSLRHLHDHRATIDNEVLVPSSDSSLRSVQSVAEIQGSKQTHHEDIGRDIDIDEGTPTLAWSMGSVSIDNDAMRRERLSRAAHEQFYILCLDKCPTIPSVTKDDHYKANWDINFDNHYINTDVGKTTYEIYKHLLISVDNMRLARVYYQKLEEYLAHEQM